MTARLTLVAHSGCMTSSDAPAWQPCATGCTTRNRHTPHCANPCACSDPGPCGHCTGCQPRPAQDGAQVCRACAQRALTALDALPDLYDALLDPSKPGGRQPGPRGNERPIPIRVGTDPDHPGPTECRTAIGETLARLVLTLHTDYGITPPRVALHGALLAAVDDRLHHKFAAIDAGDRISTAPPASRGTAETQAATLLRKVIAADHRITRLTRTLDRTDPVHQHARHVAVHLTRLLARDDAAHTVNALTGLARTARRLAAPARPEGTTLGPCPECGTPVRARRDQASDAVTCPGCDTTGPLDWWADHIAGTAAGTAEATTDQLAAWLSRRYKQPIGETRIRKWGSLCPTLKTGRMRGQRALYDVNATFAYAAEVLPSDTDRQETA